MFRTVVGTLVETLVGSTSHRALRSEAEEPSRILRLAHLRLHENGLCGQWREFVHGEWVLRGTYTTSAINMFVAALEGPTKLDLQTLDISEHNFLRQVDDQRLTKALATNITQKSFYTKLPQTATIAEAPDADTAESRSETDSPAAVKRSEALLSNLEALVEEEADSSTSPSMPGAPGARVSPDTSASYLPSLNL